MAGIRASSRIRRPRAGFTLIELLIVVGIIAFLAGVLITVVKGVVGNARAAATRSTIRKIDSLLTKRMEAFSRYIQDQDTIASKAGRLPSYVNPTYLTQSANDQRMAKVLGRKDFFRRNFPQRFSEMDSPPSYDTSKHTSATESAELLYYFLTKMPGFGTDAPDSDLFSASEIADTDGDGLMEFVDGWGNPLRFYRWPTRLFRPQLDSGSMASFQSISAANMSDPHDLWSYGIPINPTYDSASGATADVLVASLPSATGVTRGSGAQLQHEHNDPLAKDPDDPFGKLHPSGSSPSNASTQVANFEQSFHTNDTYHTPLIVSMGPDAILGLNEPNDITNFGHLAQPNLGALPNLLDNITNRNIRAGGN